MIRIHTNGEYLTCSWRADGLVYRRSLGAAKLYPNKRSRMQRAQELYDAWRTDFQPDGYVPRVSELAARYKSITDITPSSARCIDDTCARMVEFFTDITVDRITPARATDWRKHLTEGRSEATVRKHIRYAKCLLALAVREKKVKENPFAHETGASVTRATPHTYVDDAMMGVLLAACPSRAWRCVFALCRWAGRDVPSGVHGLAWSDFDWEKRVINTRRRKTGKAQVVPMSMKLYGELRAAFDAAPSGSHGPCDGIPAESSNIHKHIPAIFEAAGVRLREPFKAMRANCASDWRAMGIAAPVVAAWMGHTVAVEDKHYVAPTPSQMAMATGEDPRDALIRELQAKIKHSQ